MSPRKLRDMPLPKLRDMPLPWPAKGNWRMYLNGDVSFCRDIAISQHKDSIKYLEMEIVSPRTVTTTIPTSTSADPTSYLEWPTRRRSVFHPGSWRITTWSMPIPVTSWDDWRRDCTAESREVHLDTNPSHHYELLHSLMLSNSGTRSCEEWPSLTPKRTPSTPCDATLQLGSPNASTLPQTQELDDLRRMQKPPSR
uniref:DUF1618 domain-containing protein n=1 Tax=Oryza rufipogon TaxID=4529 RepID=A0A0E0Q2R5_ORYRU